VIKPRIAHEFRRPFYYMCDDSLIYDSLYADARLRGWSGWGGDARIANGPSGLQRITEKSYVPQSGPALELGCGEGHFCRLLAAHGYTVIRRTREIIPVGISAFSYRVIAGQFGKLPSYQTRISWMGSPPVTNSWGLLSPSFFHLYALNSIAGQNRQERHCLCVQSN